MACLVERMPHSASVAAHNRLLGGYFRKVRWKLTTPAHAPSALIHKMAPSHGAAEQSGSLATPLARSQSGERYHLQRRPHNLGVVLRHIRRQGFTTVYFLFRGGLISH